MEMNECRVYLSIIIPMYNCEHYIERCLQSIYNQGISDQEFETIVINDGSTDRGNHIVNNYKGRHGNITLLEQLNQGLSAARNRGIDLATGDYLFFVDADDLLFPNVLGILLEVIKSKTIDILAFNNRRFTEEDLKTKYTSEYHRKQIFDYKTISGFEYIAKHNYNNGVWWYFVNRSFLLETGIRFIVGKNCEDGMFTMNLLLKAKKIVHRDIDVYIYMNNSNSIVTNRNPAHQQKMISDFCFVIDYISQLILKYSSHMSMECKKRCECRRNSYIFFMMWRLFRLGSSETMNITNTLRDKGYYPFGSLHLDYKDSKYTLLRFLMNIPVLWHSLCILNGKLKIFR